MSFTIYLIPYTVSYGHPISSIEYPASSIEHRALSFELWALSFELLKIGDRRFLDPSCFPFESDGYGVAFDNDRNLAGSPGVFQHGVKMFGLFDHVIIIYLAAFFGKCFTSCPGVRSSILSEKQNFVRHFFLLGWSKSCWLNWCLNYQLLHRVTKILYQPISCLSIISNWQTGVSC